MTDGYIIYEVITAHLIFIIFLWLWYLILTHFDILTSISLYLLALSTYLSKVTKQIGNSWQIHFPLCDLNGRFFFFSLCLKAYHCLSFPILHTGKNKKYIKMSLAETLYWLEVSIKLAGSRLISEWQGQFFWIYAINTLKTVKFEMKNEYKTIDSSLSFLRR